MIKIKWILFFFLLTVLLYSRLINLSWGLPYPMHPDERNMANAIQQLQCPIQSSEFRIQNCFNPHFFAYGQFPLYLGYGIVMILKFFDGDLGMPISFEEAAFSLRLISAVASALNFIVLLKLLSVILSNAKNLAKRNTLSLDPPVASQPHDDWWWVNAILIFTFSPFFIQFSHFGTTESLLMLLYSLIIYFSFKIVKPNSIAKKDLLILAFFSGMAIATKISSTLFLIIPVSVILDKFFATSLKRPSLTRALKYGFSLVYLIGLTLLITIFFSPHNFISFPQFLGSMKYESDVAFGFYRAFYTRQFAGIIPIIFQFLKIFPYVLGWPAFIFFLLGFIFLPYKRVFNIVRLAILFGFLPSAFFYAKWTRFMTPILPLMLLFTVLFLISMYRYILNRISKIHIKYQKFYILICYYAFYILIFAFILPGIAYLSVYQNPDVRFTASEWIYKNIPDNSYILFETANVVDIPINPKSEIRNPKQIQNSNYQMISFNFYDLDENLLLQSELQEHLAKADYIFIPSRRIFANHYCDKNFQFPISNFQSNFNFQITNFEKSCKYLRKKYPLLNEYYDKLFSGELGFEKVAEFASYPNFKFQILNFKFNLVFPDEEAEETWTVFDHPVIKIYKRI